MSTQTHLHRGAAASVAAAALLVLAACCSGDGGGAQDPTSQDPTSSAPPTVQPQAISPAKLAVANLLLADAVEPAPPGSVVDTSGPVSVKGVIGEPSRQVMTCTPLELPVLDDPGPTEPDASAAAASTSVLGVAQVDQYTVVYVDEAAAERAVDRARQRAEACDESFAVHSPDSGAEAQISAAPNGVEGFRVLATYASGDAGATSDEISAVLRHGPTVLYIRANETGSGENADEDVDGLLDPTWADELIEVAAAHLAE